MTRYIGYRRLAENYGVVPVQRFRVESAIDKSRRSVLSGISRFEVYPAQFEPKNTLAGDLGFALRREGVHLEFLSRLFSVIDPNELVAWIRSEPTGQYARRACFLYEWLTDNVLDYSGVDSGNYFDAIGSRYFAGAKPINNPRWRIRDDLPGTASYCPLVTRTERVRDVEAYRCDERIADLNAEFGPDLILRSTVWLTIKESRASFAIEHEEQQQDRIQRFAAVMEQRCGSDAAPLDSATLQELQVEILGPKSLRYGLRRSPIFVGENVGFTQVVHYVGPHWNRINSMLDGLRQFTDRTAGKSSLVRAAVQSFGFVYIHPMTDGNGRISRFLINDILRRDGAIPEPLILPISATITKSAVHRYSYDRVLESYSKPFMLRYAGEVSFGKYQKGEDGVDYNLVFGAYDDAQFVWRFPDLTEHVEYLGEVVDKTISEEMRAEAMFLQQLRITRERIKEVIEGPDQDLDRIIRSVRQNDGRISNKLKSEYPLLAEPAAESQITDIIAEFDAEAHN